MRKILGLLVAMMLVAGACGDDDGANGGGGRDEALVQGLRTRIVDAQSSDGSSPIGDDEAICIARELIDAFGGQRVAAAVNLEFEDFMAQATSEERRTVVDITLGCADLASGLAEQFSADGTISESSARCVADGMLAADAFKEAVAATLTGADLDVESDPALLGELLPIFFDCLDADELKSLGD